MFWSIKIFISQSQSYNLIALFYNHIDIAEEQGAAEI